MRPARKKPPKESIRLQLADVPGLLERELAQRLKRSQTARVFGFACEEAEPGRAVVSMRVTQRHKQVNGVVHGGVLAAMADTAAGLAIYAGLPRGARIATIELKINYLEAVDGGSLLAEARVLRTGRNFSVAECDVRDSHGRLAATALLTFAIDTRKGKPR